MRNISVISDHGDLIERSFGALRWATHSDFYSSKAIQVLAAAANASGERLKTLELEEGADWYDIEFEGELLETVLGAMFVLWQTFLSTMISATKELGRHCDNELNLKLSLAQGKGKILRFGSPVLGKTGHTGPEVIDAFANYFKHRDEWPGDWRLLDERSKLTAKVIKRCGAKDNSHENIRCGIKALGVKPPYKDFSAINTCLIDWVSEIEPQVRSEIIAVARQYQGRL
ncbi:MAG TPA: hypothetical protein PLN21_14855 [Gemmatales bacterium]|nr:hypothetical protein [Gemmatales bacterium]